MSRRDKWKAFLKKLNNPPNWVAILAYATTLIACPLAVATIAMDYGHNVYAIIAYVICALIFVYTVYVTVISVRKLYLKLMSVADKFTFTRNLYKNYEFRSIFFGTWSFLFNVGYTVFLGIMGIRTDSTWYGALAVYHILLALARGGMLIQNSKDERRFKSDQHALQKAKVGTYRYCGIMMLALTVALVFSVMQMAVAGEGFHVPTWAVYLFAGVALWRVVMSIINAIRSGKYDDLVARAVRYVNMVTALFSVLSLQTALFAKLPFEINLAMWNSIMGGLVCIITAVFGVYMLIFSAHAQKRLMAEEVQASQWARQEEGYNRDGYFEEYGKKEQQNRPRWKEVQEFPLQKEIADDEQTEKTEKKEG